MLQRTETLIAEVAQALADQAEGIERMRGVSAIAIFVQLHPDGNVRRVQVEPKAESQGGRIRG